jgi:hypothetical protein
MKKIFLLLFTVILLSSLSLYTGCGDDDNDPPAGGGQTVTTTLTGTVFDESNNPLAGVEVKSAGQTTMTNNYGGFTFSNIQVPQGRFVVNAHKSGYFRGSVADVPKANATTHIKVYLVSAGITETISATSGGTVAVDNGTGVEISSNSVAKSDGSVYTGDVNVSVAYLDPTAENFSEIIPGGDLLAQRTDNSEATLYSYGIIKVEMKSNAGENLQIKNGNSSKIVVDIPASMVASAPATIPLWHYDDATGLWKEEGTATKEGDKYIGNVGHFSDWNCDVPEGTATVKGLVVDCNNLPVPGISVKIGQANASTGSDGRFERRVPANTGFDVQVLGNKNFGLASVVVPVAPMSAGTIKDVGTLAIDCPVYVKGVVKCGTTIKYAQVIISWPGGYNSQYTDGEGKFNIPVDLNKAATVSIYTIDSKYKTLETTTPAVRGQTRDLGTIEVCDQVVTGSNQFTVNGDGMNNRTFVFLADTFQVFGFYDIEDSTTFIYMVKTAAPDTVIFWLQFTGNSTGTPPEKWMFFAYNSKWYVASDDDPAGSIQANITKYSGIGGLIEGTFGGVLPGLFNTAQSVTLSNGKFSVVRIISSEQANKIKSKIPPEIRSRIRR